MERLRWTDERIDERMAAIDERFERQFEESRMFREEMRAGFAALQVEIGAVRGEIRSDVGAMRGEIRSEIGAVRGEIRSEIGGVRGEIDSVRGEIDSVRGELASVRSDLAAFQRHVTLIVAGFGVGLLGILGAGQL
jgi:hypothetical protein